MQPAGWETWAPLAYLQLFILSAGVTGIAALSFPGVFEIFMQIDESQPRCRRMAEQVPTAVVSEVGMSDHPRLRDAAIQQSLVGVQGLGFGV